MTQKKLYRGEVKVKYSTECTIYHILIPQNKKNMHPSDYVELYQMVYKIDTNQLNCVFSSFKTFL